MSNPTPSQANALSVALVHGQVVIADNPNGRVDPRTEGQPRTLEILANGPGWLTWRSNPAHRLGVYVLTDEGRKVALALPDKESSASRQHRIDTGRYLKYGDRPEFQESPFKVGDHVQRLGRPNGYVYRVASIRKVTNVSGQVGWFYNVYQLKGTGDYLFTNVTLPTYEYHKVDTPSRFSQARVLRRYSSISGVPDWGLLREQVAQAAAHIANGNGRTEIEIPDGDDVALVPAIDLIRDLVTDWDAFGADHG